MHWPKFVLGQFGLAHNGLAQNRVGSSCRLQGWEGSVFGVSSSFLALGVVAPKGKTFLMNFRVAQTTLTSLWRHPGFTRLSEGGGGRWLVGGGVGPANWL